MPIFSSPKAHSGQREGEKELLPMIFEKAWAKLHLSYEATAGGLTEDAASYLSAGVLKRLPLERGAENDSAWVLVPFEFFPYHRSIHCLSKSSAVDMSQRQWLAGGVHAGIEP